jgi:hypothetical protein
MTSPLAADRQSASTALLAAMTAMQPTPTTQELADSLGWDLPRQAVVLAALEDAAMIESWQDPSHASKRRVMLSETAADRLGVVLHPSGERWQLEPLDHPDRSNYRKSMGPGRRST